MNPFHYAFQVKDLESTRKFYVEILGCAEGRSTESWVDFDFFGHQLSAHITDTMPVAEFSGQVDGIKVPMPHFGCLLDPQAYDQVRQNLEAAGIEFIIPSYLRYKGKPGEHHTMFVLDYSGNPIEFKSFTNGQEVFEG